MPEDYTVQEGDCIASLAYNRGLLWKTVWDHPLNALLKRQRKDPNILKPGDIVHLPDKELKTLDRPTDQRHMFVRKGVPAKLRLRVLDDQIPDEPAQKQSPQERPQQLSGEDPDTSPTEQQVPRAGAPYILIIDGNLTQGNTDNDGMVEVSIPPNARKGRLTVEPGTLRESIFNLNLGWLDPADSVTGIKQRLANFGFDCGDQSSDITPGFQDALRAFQDSRGLEITGENDDTSRNKLKQEHGS